MKTKRWFAKGARGAIAALTLAGLAALPAGTGATTYTYDAGNRLTAVTYDNCDTVAYAYDAGGNMTTITPTVSTTQPGDFDASGKVDVADAILALQVAAHVTPSLTPDKRCTDASGDSRIGLEDVIYILQKTSGTR